MARGDSLAAGIRARIAASVHRLTLTYPPARPVIAGVSPSPRPASPLTGVAPVEVIAIPTPVPSQPDVTVQCLWLDTPETTLPGPDKYQRSDVGWVIEADAMARVTVENGALMLVPQIVTHSVVNPDGSTTVLGRYRLFQLDAMGSSTGKIHSYSCWLKGALKQ